SNGNPITIIDPNTGLPFPGNKIPPQRLDSAAQMFVNNYIPAATNPDGLIFYSTKIQNNDGQWMGRLDEHLSNKDLLFFRAFTDNYTSPSDGPTSNVLAYYFDTSYQFATALTADWTHTFSTHFLTDNNFSFDRHNGDYTSYPNTPTSQSLGMQIIQQAADNSLTIGVGPDFGFAIGGTVQLVSENFNYRNTTTIVRKNQGIRLGADIVRSHFDIPRSSYLGDGQTFFWGNFSGSYLSDFLLGLPSFFSQSQGYR